MFLQYEIWKDCSYGCSYCFHRNIPKVRDKVKALEYVIDSIRSKKLEPNATVGFIGGEFFGGQLASVKVLNLFYQLIGETVAKLKEVNGRLLMTAGLMASDSSDWLEFCDFIHNQDFDDNILLCTSWDKLYRFTNRQKMDWEKTVRETQSLFPKMKFHVEMIITQYLVEALLEDTFSVRDFEKEWNCRVDLNIPYADYSWNRLETKEQMAKRLPLFFPKRKDFLTLLKEKPDAVNLIGLTDSSLHSSEFHYSLNDRDWIVLPHRNKLGTTCTNLWSCTTCNGCGYVDSNVKIQQDIRMIQQSFQ